VSFFDEIVNNMLLEYGQTMVISTSDYYNQLSDHLNQFGMSIGGNKINPDLGYVDINQKGIYKDGKQIGKIELKIKNNILYIEHIKSYGKHYNENFGLVGKIYPFHHQMALVHNLIVKSNAVNEITKTAFLNNFKDFKIIKNGSNLTAIPNDQQS
jgi:hypothetical protein